MALPRQARAFDAGRLQKEEVTELINEEKELLSNAYDGFEAAFSKEDFPMCGMDQYTMMYLLAELARRIGKMMKQNAMFQRC